MSLRQTGVWIWKYASRLGVNILLHRLVLTELKRNIQIDGAKPARGLNNSKTDNRQNVTKVVMTDEWFSSSSSPTGPDTNSEVSGSRLAKPSEVSVELYLLLLIIITCATDLMAACVASKLSNQHVDLIASWERELGVNVVTPRLLVVDIE